MCRYTGHTLEGRGLLHTAEGRPMAQPHSVLLTPAGIAARIAPNRLFANPVERNTVRALLAFTASLQTSINGLSFQQGV